MTDVTATHLTIDRDTAAWVLVRAEHGVELYMAEDSPETRRRLSADLMVICAQLDAGLVDLVELET